MEDKTFDKNKFPITRIDSSKIKEGQYLDHDELHNTDGTLVGPAPTKEYPSLEEWRSELESEAKSVQPETGLTSLISVEEQSVQPEEEWTSPISVEELCKKEFSPMPWVVEHLFARATINQISAPPNQWKTWATLHMAICIAKGEKVFGHLNTEQQGVMIVNEEDPEYLLQERFKALLDQPDGLPLFLHVEKGIKLDDEDDEKVDNLIGDMKKNNCSVIIFDSLSVTHNADENSAKEMNAVFSKMKRFTREGFTVIFTNHHRKKPRGPYKDDPQEQTRGSTVINAVPAGHITCEERREGEKKFVIIRQVKLKSAKKMDPFRVRIEESEGKMCFVYDGIFEEDVDAAAKLRNQLYEEIQKSDLWLGVRDFQEITGKSDKSVRDQLRALEKEKMILGETRATLVKRGARVSSRDKPSSQEKLYFKIVPEDG